MPEQAQEVAPEILPCRQCGERAVAVFAMSEGCVVYPDDREQALCWQHAHKAAPLGSMELTRDLTAGSFAQWWRS